MVSWHIVLAMSGQLADLSLPTNRSLTFEPRLPAPFSLPLMLPGGEDLGLQLPRVWGQWHCLPCNLVARAPNPSLLQRNRLTLATYHPL